MGQNLMSRLRRIRNLNPHISCCRDPADRSCRSPCSIAHPPSNELFSEITIRIKFQTFSLAKLDRDFSAASRARTMARRTSTSSSPTPSLTNHSTDWRISKPAPRRFSTIAKLLRFSLGLLFSRFRGAASQWCASRSSCGVPVRTRL